MRTLLLVFLVTTLLGGAAGCGDDEPNVGATCSASGGCDKGLTCSTAFPGGYCTAACTTTGTTAGCPEGSICDTVTGAGTTCVRICQTNTDCRAGIECNGVSGINIKACKPK